MITNIYKILLISLILSLTACASSQEEPSKVPEKEKIVQKSQPLRQSVSTPAIRQGSKRKINYAIDTSRPAQEIKKEYPFDIELKTAAGKIVNSADILKSDGKPTVLLFWLTTCVPCRYEMKAISEKFDGWKKEANFNFYAISTDFQKNYGHFVERVKQSNWSFEAYHDVNREFRYVMPGELNGLPQTFILDKEGRIVFHKKKYRGGDENLLFEKIKQFANK